MEETIILDCNRLSSAEYLAGNNSEKAVFTNQTGTGINVKIGDRVSVHNSFISAIGQADGAIEISDKFLEDRVITYTKLTNSDFVNSCNDKIYPYSRQTASNVTETITNNANSTNLLINYYKNANGENHFFLPRVFLTDNSQTGSPPIWNDNDRITFGRTNGSLCFSTTLNASYFAPLNKSALQMFMVPDDMYYFQGGQDSVSAQRITNCFKYRCDNSRYQIYINTDTRYGHTTEAAPALINGSLFSPALMDYIEYIEKVPVEVSSGFRSAEAISSKITSDLRKNDEPKRNDILSQAKFNTNASIITERATNFELNSPTYHTFYSAGQYTNNKETSASYIADVNASTISGSLTNLYLSTYQHIGVKRPKLYDSMIDWWNNYRKYLISAGSNPKNFKTRAYLTFSLQRPLHSASFRKDSTDPNKHIILTNIRWDAANASGILQAFDKVFQQQARHPELWENKFNVYGGFVNASNSRFIHMNAMGEDKRSAVDKQYQFSLGHDYYMTSGSNVDGLTSVPLFFDYNPDYTGISTEGLSWEEGYSYGAFLKYNDLGVDRVAFTTSRLGYLEAADSVVPASQTTIPNCYFSFNKSSASQVIESNTRMGFDPHFNAYGNVFIGLTDGYLTQMYDVYQELEQYPTAYNVEMIKSNKFTNRIYLGALEPALDFNASSRRFEIKDLHTGERIQNRFNAGGILSGSNHLQQVVPEFPSQGEKVYKINKRLFSTNFTPAMMPYSLNRIDPLKLSTGVPTADFQVDMLNKNLEPWTIYDQYCGIIIKDFGYSKEKFSEGIFGTLGFTYNQFNASESSTNDITSRVGNSNKGALPYAFTNAEVSQKQTINFPTNIFGAGIYSLQLPLTMSFNGSVGAGADIFREALPYETYPAISEAAHSVVLEAPNLPKKVQQGYYLIKSDILDTSAYHTGQSGNSLPVMSVVDKVNDTNDFFVGGESTIEYTFTKDKMITSVQTQILNPDGTLAEVGDNSGVIYKIQRTINNNLDIVQQVLQENQKK